MQPYRELNIDSGVTRLSAAEYRALLCGKPISLPSSFAPGFQKTEAKLNSDAYPVASEHSEQVALVQWLTYLGIRYFAIPNGSLRHVAVAVKLRAEGVVSGPSDLVILPEVGTGLPIVFLEMKRSKGGKTSLAQKEFLEHIEGLSKNGHKVCALVAPGSSAAREMLMGIGYGVR